MAVTRSSAIEKLFQFSERVPMFGFAMSAIFAASGTLLTYNLSKRIGGIGALCGWVLTGLAAPFLMYALFGLFLRHERKMRIRTMREKQDLYDLTWQEFEELVADAYGGQGYKVEEVGGQSDGGIDLILHKQKEIAVVQCKQYRNWKIGVRYMREFYGAKADHPEANHGIFVTCGVYTKEAKAYAERHGIEIVDGDALLALIGNVSEARAALPRKSQTPTCPDCGTQMVKKTARNGKNAGSQFWACPTYPKCNGTRPISQAA